MCIFFKGRQCSGLPFAETCVPYLYETTAWMDCEPVRVLGTFAPTSSDCFRGQRSATGASQLVKVPRPTVIAAYNQGVGGTGQIDQLLHYCDDQYRTHVFTCISFYVAVVNASALYHCSVGNETKTSLLDSTKSMIEEWCTELSSSVWSSLFSPHQCIFRRRSGNLRSSGRV